MSAATGSVLQRDGRLLVIDANEFADLINNQLIFIERNMRRSNMQPELLCGLELIYRRLKKPRWVERIREIRCEITDLAHHIPTAKGFFMTFACGHLRSCGRGQEIAGSPRGYVNEMRNMGGLFVADADEFITWVKTAGACWKAE